jgi:hypothetical protein
MLWQIMRATRNRIDLCLKHPISPLDIHSYIRLYSSHLNRREGTVSTASRNCGSEGSACGWRCNAPPISGSRRLTPWILRSTRLKWLNNPSGKQQTPCDLGLCKSKLKAKTAASRTCGFTPFFQKLFYRQGATIGHPPPFFPRPQPP